MEPEGGRIGSSPDSRITQVNPYCDVLSRSIQSGISRVSQVSLCDLWSFL